MQLIISQDDGKLKGNRLKEEKRSRSLELGAHPLAQRLVTRPIGPDLDTLDKRRWDSGSSPVVEGPLLWFTEPLVNLTSLFP